MKSILLFLTLIIFSFGNIKAQLPNGSIAPDFTLTDLDGTTHNLYEDYLNNGYTVFLDFSAVWCPPCWDYHTTGALEDLYENHGPSGHPNVLSSTTDDVMVFLIEADGSSETCISGSGCGTLGDWTLGTTFPIICTDGTSNNNSVSTAYDVPYYPTVYQVCPDRTLTLCGTSSTPYSLVTSCLPPPSQQNDARSFMNSSASSGCSSSTPKITIQNYGLSSLTEVKIDVYHNGNLESTTVFDETYDDFTNSLQPLNLGTLDLVNVVLDPVTGLVNNDIITIEVSLPNGVLDADPLNNQTITYIVDLGFDNAYWNGDLSIDVAGGPQNSWYLKQVSTNSIIASGFGGVTGATNDFNLTFDECYTLQSINGANLPYTITDAQGQILLDGSATGVEDFDNFTTGSQIWTGINDNIELNPILIYPVPAKNRLYIYGKYEYLKLIDLLGNVVIEANYNSSIDISFLNSGMYLLELNSGINKKYKKVQINN